VICSQEKHFILLLKQYKHQMSWLWAGIQSKESIDNGFNVGRQIDKE